MASILYTQGDTHEVNGIVCHMERIPPENTAMLLMGNWFATPEGVEAHFNPVEHEEPVTEENLEPVEESEEESEEEDELTQLKAKAKELGLTGYGKCSVEKLRAKIEKALAE